MATDEREICVCGHSRQDHKGETGGDWCHCECEHFVHSPLHERAEAAEQRVRELREAREKDLDHCRMLDRDLTKALEKAEAAEAKLATTVEALKGALDLIDCMTDESRGVSYVEIEDEEERLQRALSEIEQGDAK